MTAIWTTAITSALSVTLGEARANASDWSPVEHHRPNQRPRQCGEYRDAFDPEQ